MTQFPLKKRIQIPPASPLWSRVTGFQVSRASGASAGIASAGWFEAPFPSFESTFRVSYNLPDHLCTERATPRSPVVALPVRAGLIRIGSGSKTVCGPKKRSPIRQSVENLEPDAIPEHVEGAKGPRCYE